MRIVLHGVLAERFGAEHVIQTNNPADAIEGLTRQLEDWPRDMFIDAVGYQTEEQLRQAETDEIHLMPRMYGGGGIGKFFGIILGAALIAVSFLVPPAGVTILGLTITKGSLILLGAAMVLTGVSALFMKAPTFDKSNDPPPSKYLGINKNTTTAGTLIPLAYGRIKLAGHWLSLQSDSDHLVMTSFPTSTS